MLLSFTANDDIFYVYIHSYLLLSLLNIKIYKRCLTLIQFNPAKKFQYGENRSIRK